MNVNERMFNDVKLEIHLVSIFSFDNTHEYRQFLTIITLSFDTDKVVVRKVSSDRFLERKICNPLVNVADRLKKLRGSRQPYLANVKIVLM